jgi:methylmalonyl-CoA epimerase
MIRKIDHIAIAVRDLAAALKFWEETLGLKATGTEVVEEQKVRVAFLPVGESKLELLEPTDPEGPVGKFLARSGEGIHHIALRVDDLSAELARLKGLGVRLIDEEPRCGAGGARIAFIHPKATLGVLLELCQRDEGGLK